MTATTQTQGKIEKALRHEVESLQNLVKNLSQQLQQQQQTIDELEQKLFKQQERIAQLEEELRKQKKLKGRPKIRASQLNDKKANSERDGKRPGSAKKSKKAGFEVDEEKIIQAEEIPTNAKFNGYRDYDVQELKIERHNIRFRLAEYVTEDGKTIVGELPPEYRRGHYGPNLLGYILYQHYQCRVPQTLSHEQMDEWGILRRLSGNTSEQRPNIEEMQQLLWDYYRQLQQYPEKPTAESKAQLELGFEQVFGRYYLHHDSLNQVLTGFRELKAELVDLLKIVDSFQH